MHNNLFLENFKYLVLNGFDIIICRLMAVLNTCLNGVQFLFFRFSDHQLMTEGTNGKDTTS